MSGMITYQSIKRDEGRSQTRSVASRHAATSQRPSGENACGITTKEKKLRIENGTFLKQKQMTDKYN
jgi:hypothetical protein